MPSSWSNRHLVLIAAAAGSLAVAAACSNTTAAGANTSPTSVNDAGTGAPAASNLPCEVEAVFKARCQTCHSSNPQYGASVPLVTWDDFQKPSAGKKVHELVKERIHHAERPMPPGQPLSSEELASLDAWIGGGTPKSSAACTNGIAPEEAVKALPCTPDTILKPARPFNMTGGDVDQYVCFGVDVNLEQKRHVTALAPHVDDKDIVHHILLFQSDSAESAEPFACAAFGSIKWRLVAGWAPGADNFVLPDEAGFPEHVGTTHWVLQVHYNTTKKQTGTDASGYELCTTDTLRPNDAAVMGLGSINFDIPARGTRNIRCDYAIGRDLDGATFFNAWPHMHTYGTAMSTEWLAGGALGTPTRIVDQKVFSFESQVNFSINQRVARGDVMRTRCSWRNTSPEQIGFGENTGDEMCFDFISYYPAAKVGWIAPAFNARCENE